MEKTYEMLQQYAVNSLEYQKGRALHQRGQAALSSAEEAHGRTQIQATVRDLSRRYDVEVTIQSTGLAADGNWGDFDIEESSCSCGEYHTPGKLCRHEIAAVLQYFCEGELVSSVHTSAACISMIQAYEKRYTLQYQKSNISDVKVVPKFVTEGKKIGLEFFAGTRHLYPIRDLTAFKQSYQKGEDISFGKQLSYPNCEYSYDSDSAALIQVICLQIDSYLNHWSQQEKYTFDRKISNVELEEGFADLYMKAFCGRELELIEDGKSRMVHVIKENPQVKLILEKKGKDGARLWLPDKWKLAEGNRHIYLFGEDTVYICDEYYSRALRIFYRNLLQVAYPGSGYMDINNSDFPSFIHYVLPEIQENINLECRDLSLEEFVPPMLQVKFTINLWDILELKMETRYGKRIVHLGEKSDTNLVRDVEKEQALKDLLERYLPSMEKDEENGQEDCERYIIENGDAIGRFLEFCLPQLYSFGSVVLEDGLADLHFDEAPQIKAGMRFMDHFLELGFESDELSEKQLKDVLRAYHEKQHYHRLEDGRILKLSDEFADKLAEFEDVMDIDAREAVDRPVSLPGYCFLFADEMLASMQGIDYQPGKEIRDMAERMKRTELEMYPVPETIGATLREYQIYGYRWLKMLQDYHFNGILADDMGLGKTLQTITLLVSDQGKGSSIIVCPASLIYNWQHELELFASNLRIQVVAGNAKERKELIEQYTSYDVLITSYDLLRRDLEIYEGCKFFYQILDEAQYIKNHMTMNAKAVKQINAAYRLALTGTPIENSLSELWSIFDYLMPGYLYSYTRFRKQFEMPIMKNEDAAARNRLRKMTAPFLLRRSKSQVLSDLPEKDEKTIYSGMEDEQRKLYLAAHKQLVDQLQGIDSAYYEKNKIFILSQLTKLRQICCHPALCYDDYQGSSAKLEACMELVQRAVKGKHKVLLFSQFTSMLDLIRERLAEQNTKYYCLTGNTDKQERQRLVDEFQNDDTPVFLISLKAGGTGLNLTAADIVIHYDPWWNVAAQNQATDRAHRIGQKNTVTVYRLIAKDSLEEGIIKLQESKKALSDDILSMDFGAIASMSKDELLALLSTGEVANQAK